LAKTDANMFHIFALLVVLCQDAPQQQAAADDATALEGTWKPTFARRGPFGGEAHNLA
jgi:hypothetical protein